MGKISSKKKSPKNQDDDFDEVPEGEDDDFDEDIDEVLSSDEMVADEIEGEGKRSEDEKIRALRDVVCSGCKDRSKNCKVKADYGCP